MRTALAFLLLLWLAPRLHAEKPREALFLALHDETEQRYVLALPEDHEASQPHDLLICLHGHGADRWQYLREERGETRAARAIAAQHRMILVAPDYRGTTSWMGPAAELDVVQLIGDIKRQFAVRHVILSGASMGAAGALTFTALHPDLVDGVIALNGHGNHVEFSNFQEPILISFGGTKASMGQEYRKRSAEFFPEKFTMPVALTAGGKDTLVPPGSVLRLARAIEENNPAVYLDYQEARGHETEYEAALAAHAFVVNALAAKPVGVSVCINGRSTLPSAGSAAGVWFYARDEAPTQVLLTGHASVPGSWRMTAVLGKGDEVRLSFTGGETLLTNIQFQSVKLGPADLLCRADTNALVITARNAGAVKLTGFARNMVPVSYAPERRPFSRGPVAASPDPHPTIAEALVEWDWRMQDGIQTPRERRTYLQAIEKLTRQTGDLVTERLRLGNLSPDEASAWVAFQESAANPNATTSAEARWLEFHRLRRQIVLSNPLFKIPSLLFLKHVPSVMSHQLTQVYGYCSRPGGGIFALEEPGRSMRTRKLTPASLPPGNFMTPEVSYDAQRLLFAYCPVTEAPTSWDYNDATRHLRYHIYEMSLADGTVRALTEGDTDNFSPVCLPSNEILFLSTRRGGYHRCGRGPCFVYTLARMGENGENPRSVSFHETHEWDPSLLKDGRVIYTRWDYVDRNAVHYQQLWSALPDGNNAQIYYGNNTWNPTGTWEARAIPGSSKIMATAAPHHGMSAGSVIVLDTARGVDGAEPICRVTPDVRFPESESPLAFGPSPAGYDFDTPVTQHWRSPLLDPSRVQSIPEEEKRWPGHCYKSPWPLSEKFFIVSYSFDQLVGEPGPNMPNMFGLYFADAFGNKELIYRDPAISSLWVRPLTSRPAPPDLARTSSDKNTATGTFFLQDVTESWPDLPGQNLITHLRVIQVLLKTTPNADSPKVGAAFAAPGKQVLGTVPVEADGSALFEVPARTPVLFQALNAEGRAVQTMRSLVYLQPGEHQSCVGCHENRMRSVETQGPAQALRRPPSQIKPGPEGSRPFSYPRLVQPVLDRHCVQCHNGKEPGRPVLTSEPEGDFTKSYNALVSRVSFSAWGRPDDNFEPLTKPLRFGAAASPLMAMLDKGHGDVVFTAEDQERLSTWIDANALFYGTFDVGEQRRQLAGEIITGPQQ